MLDKDTCLKIEERVLSNLQIQTDIEDTSTSKILNLVCAIAVKASILTLQEYEQLNKSQEE